jgi:hypothetical protein
MRAKLLPAAAIALVAAACDDPQPTQPAKPIVVRSEAQDQLHRYDDMTRAIALRRAIYDGGGTCRRVTKSGYVQEYDTMSMWTASCDSGRSYAIFVAPDATAQVRRCETMAELKLPACTIRQAATPPG